MKPTLASHKIRDKRVNLRLSDEELAIIYNLLNIKADDNLSTKIREYLIEQSNYCKKDN